MSDVTAGSIADLLSLRAARLPEQRFTFLEDGESRESSLTYAELNRRVVAVAAGLRAHAKAGDRVLILVPLGLDYTVAVLACAVARVVAVPAYPPEPGATAQALAPIVGIVEDCVPALVLVGGPVDGTLRQMEPLPARLAALPRVDLAALAAEGAGARRTWAVEADDTAVMLYTSGSTGNPKGVMLSQGNFLHVARAMATDCRLDTSSTFCIWIPGYHISGLYSGIMLPLWAGARCIGFTPRSFVERPARWLEAIDRHKVTFSGAPTFAYDMLTRSVTPEQSAGLDLSSWQVAVVGGEAVRREVIEKFVARFTANGFQRNRFYTMFGLTEAVMISTGGGYQTGPTEEWIDRDRLQEGIAVPVPADHPAARASIASGFALPDTEVLVVDPKSLQPRPNRVVGEIWIGGKGVGKGYWGRQPATLETFGARTADGFGPYLRTGDLAYMAGGQLNIVGRLKEMIIIRGLNFYPDDLEGSVRRSHPLLAEARLAAFAIELDGQEHLAVAVELEGGDQADWAAAIRRGITADHGIQVAGILSVPPRAIPTTGTGKIQRNRCAQQVASGAWTIAGRTTGTSVAESGFDRAAFATLPLEPRRAEAIRVLRRTVARLAGLDQDIVATNRPLPEFGIDSILTVKLNLEIQDLFAVTVPTARLRDATTIEALASLILDGGEARHTDIVTDRALAADIRPGTAAATDTPELLFLTGVTGFLGGFLLGELLRTTQARIACLIRAATPEAGLDRLRARLTAIGLWEDRFAERLEAVNGDLNRPALGLDDATFVRLGEQVHSIYHNGASVDFVAPYATLERANVGSVEDCLRLATLGRPKPVHFTSTLAVFNGTGRLGLSHVAESNRLDDPQQLVGGYAQSKWVAESLLTQAGARGLPVGIYRAGFIGGHGATGFWNTEDFLCRLIKGSAQLGVYPDITLDLPFVSVDYVARAIVALSRRPVPGSNAYHLIAPTPLALRDLMRWTNDAGHPLKPIPYGRWRRMLREALPITNDLFPVLPFLIEPGANGDTVIDVFLKPDQPIWADAVTRERLAGSGVAADPVDCAYVRRCLGYFHEVGFMATPKAVS